MDEKNYHSKHSPSTSSSRDDKGNVEWPAPDWTWSHVDAVKDPSMQIVLLCQLNTFRISSRDTKLPMVELLLFEEKVDDFPAQQPTLQEQSSPGVSIQDPRPVKRTKLNYSTCKSCKNINGAAFQPGFGQLSDSWKCPACSTQISNRLTKCKCCHTARPGVNPKQLCTEKAILSNSSITSSGFTIGNSQDPVEANGSGRGFTFGTTLGSPCDTDRSGSNQKEPCTKEAIASKSSTTSAGFSFGNTHDPTNGSLGQPVVFPNGFENGASFEATVASGTEITSDSGEATTGKGFTFVDCSPALPAQKES
eukprot:scaffold10358_cov105-Cylindrotheca_fusiformis.AAC.1